MIRLRLFHRHYAILAGSILLFVLAGFLASRGILQFVASREPGFHPPLVFAKLVDRLVPGDRVRSLRMLEKLNDEDAFVDFTLLDRDGRAVYPPEARIELKWDRIEKPEAPYASVNVLPGSRADFSPGRPSDSLLRLPGEPPQFLYYRIRAAAAHGPPAWIPFTIFGSLAVSVMLGIGMALWLIFRSLRAKARVADRVLQELQRGNLKARLPVTSLDEMGQAMLRFNRMADEIERLVEKIRLSEKSRMTLLQELTHDLRTPVTSLKNLLATVSKRESHEDREVRAEITGMCMQEVDYFERLIEDLLMLAQVGEPGYHAHQEPLVIGEILGDEADSLEALQSTRSRPISLAKDIPETRAALQGDPHLIRRLFRNALDNAFFYARSEVRVSARTIGAESLQVTIEDDGPGLSPEALASFGERRLTRALGVARSQDAKISLGLGSVIMKTIADLHQGELKAENLLGSDGQAAGARIVLTLPRR